MSKRLLSNEDFCRAAKRLRCDVAAIKAVAEVESRGAGFYANGFPTILFERHVFRKYTDGRYNESHPHLSGPAGNYGKAGQNQRNKFNEAYALDPIAAIKACSWGKFQVMGFNWKVAGYSSVVDFFEAMQRDEGEHLNAFIGFVIGNRLDDEIRNHDWAGFAYGYNGEGYKKNNYHTAMARAYKKFAKENIDCSKVASTSSAVVSTDKATITSDEQAAADTTSAVGSDTPSSSQEQPPSQTDTIIAEKTTETEDSTITEKVMAQANTVGDKFQAFQGVLDKFGFAIEDAKRSVGTVIMTFGKLLLAVAMFAWGMFKEHPEIFIPAAVVLAVIVYLLWDRSGKRVAEAKAGVPVAVVEKLIETK